MCWARVGALASATTFAEASLSLAVGFSSSLYSSFKLSLKSSDSLFFLSGGDCSGLASSKGKLSTNGFPKEELGWTGVFPREKSADEDYIIRIKIIVYN